MRSSAIKAARQQAPKELVCNGRMRAEWTVHINPHWPLRVDATDTPDQPRAQWGQWAGLAAAADVTD